MADQKKKYIFIVGVSRSGTSLMRKILNKSTQIALCDENYYLGHLLPSEGMRQKFRKFGSLKNDGNVRNLIDYLYSPDFHSYSRWKTLNWQWKWFVTEIPKEKMLDRILASDRTERGFFDTLLELFAESQGAEVRGEKTPAHIRYVEELLAWFPQARIIHMMRDPRAIFVSEVRRRKEKSLSPPYKQISRIDILLKLFLLAQISWTWADGYRRLIQYQRKFGVNYRLVKFEDLVARPGEILPQLCDEFGLEFQDRMMAQTVISDGFQSGKEGFDSKAARRWENKIPGWANWWLKRLFKDKIVNLGYTV